MLYLVCNVSDLSDESLQKFRVNEKDVCVGKHNGKIFACDNFCPHRGASMHKGWFTSNCIVCHLHYFEFDIDSGKLMRIPDKWHDQSPYWKQSDDLVMYDTVIKDGCLYINM